MATCQVHFMVLLPTAGLAVYRFPPYLEAQSTRPCTGCTAGALLRRFPEALPKAE